jgi:hypothetical protein
VWFVEPAVVPVTAKGLVSDPPEPPDEVPSYDGGRVLMHAQLGAPVVEHRRLRIVQGVRCLELKMSLPVQAGPVLLDASLSCSLHGSAGSAHAEIRSGVSALSLPIECPGPEPTMATEYDLSLRVRLLNGESGDGADAFAAFALEAVSAGDHQPTGIIGPDWSYVLGGHDG